ncbi:MAG: hypothetical protein ACOVVK_16880 [Elsteraceae bacterium]
MKALEQRDHARVRHENVSWNLHRAVHPRAATQNLVDKSGVERGARRVEPIKPIIGIGARRVAPKPQSAVSLYGSAQRGAERQMILERDPVKAVCEHLLKGCVELSLREAHLGGAETVDMPLR